ncbi:MAG: GNAT family N-acetyltransferase [Tessaracoccus sp.]|uniref:GNAT family N-acetyltransferase n=1 Tax=Tessaracoccus sp. TaxID=1971211 RepID=UPI001EC3822E|nr:GNAT family protein [Tessaracoccus sp.]MBK7820250.1 GNAT family N-acetyltransferase [Tessaracoccus sp.]
MTSGEPNQPHVQFTLEEIFPPFALRIACGSVVLSVLRDDDIPELVELVRGGIQVPDLPMPFLQDWHEQPFAPGSPDGFPATSLAWWWTQRASFAPDDWRLALVVRRDGVLVGMQDLHARDFAQTSHIETGSWLGRAHQGRGTGTLMRQLVVGLAFDELGAATCGSGYIVGNHASAAVSRKVGYVDNGRERIVQHTQRGKVGVEEQRVVVTPATYVRPDAEVTVEGADRLRRFLGTDARTGE